MSEHDDGPTIDDKLTALGFTTLGDDPNPEVVERLLREWTETLDQADELRRNVERRAVIERLPRGYAGMVDAALGSVPGDPSSGLQGGQITFDPVDPWPDEVDGASLLDELETRFKAYLVVPDGAAPAMALWALHAHAHAASEVSPYLTFSSPVRGCGKTTALTLIHAVTPRPVFASNISPAALFRTVEAHRPTLIIDEADAFLKLKEELRGILNSAHFRAGAYVLRAVGDDHEPRRFSTWCPKALALIGELPTTIRDRSVIVRMQRLKPGDQIRRLRLDRVHDEFGPLRRKAARWASDTIGQLREADPDVPDDLRDRQADNARPLLAIADSAGGRWPERARKALRRLSAADVDREEEAIQLLADIGELFDERNVDRLSSHNVCATLGTREDRPWSEYRHGKAITPRQVAKLLRPFEIKPKPLWIDNRTLQGYQREDFDEAISRYVRGSGPQGTQDFSDDAGSAASEGRKGSQGHGDSGRKGKRHKRRTLVDIVEQNRGVWEEEPDTDHEDLYETSPDERRRKREGELLRARMRQAQRRNRQSTDPVDS